MYERTLDGLVAIVTGAGAGIGRKTASLLAERGAAVAAVDINGDAAAITAVEIRRAGGNAVEIVADVSDESQIAAMVETTSRTFGRLDILFNNAAIITPDHLQHDRDAVLLDISIWDRTMDVNSRGTWLACKHAIPLMIKSGGGSIINVSSDAALRGDMVRTAYAASKAAVAALSCYVASQFGRDGIRCNVIRPVAMVERPISISEEARSAFEGAFALGRTGTAEDVAKVVAFLASSEAGWITGANIPVNGGFEVGCNIWPVNRKSYEAARAAAQ